MNTTNAGTTAPREVTAPSAPRPEESAADAGERFRWSAVGETAIGLALLLLANGLFFPDRPGFLGVVPHPYWLIVILIAVRYGFLETLFASGLAALLYGGFIVRAHGGAEFSTFSFWTDFSEPLSFLIVGGVISEFNEHHQRREAALRGQLAARRRELQQCDIRERALSESLRRLDDQIIGTYTNVVDLFKALSVTRHMNRERIKQDLLAMLKRFLRVERAVYYEVENGRLVPGHSLGGRIDPAAEGANSPTADDVVLNETLHARRPAHLSQFAPDLEAEKAKPGRTLIAGPIKNSGGQVIGVAAIEQMPFSEYNPTGLKLFATILEWWGAALEEAAQLEALREESVYDEALGANSYSYFKRRIVEEFRRARTYSIPLSLALLRFNHAATLAPDALARLRRLIAQIMTEAVTVVETVSAYRDESYLMLTFPMTAAGDAAEKMRTIAAEIAACDLHPYPDKSMPLSISWTVVDFQLAMASHEEMLVAVEAELPPVPTPAPAAAPAAADAAMKGGEKPRPRA